MKKLLIILLLALGTTTAMAQHHGHDYRHYGRDYYRNPGSGWWVAPIVIGAIGYQLGRQQAIVVQQPVYVETIPTLPPPQTPAPYGYHWEQLVDRACNCTRYVLVPN